VQIIVVIISALITRGRSFLSPATQYTSSLLRPSSREARSYSHRLAGTKTLAGSRPQGQQRSQRTRRETEYTKEVEKRMRQRSYERQPDGTEQSAPQQEKGLLLTTFNLLAPCYKRVDEGALRASTPQTIPSDRGLLGALQEALAGGRQRESDYDPMWRARAKDTLDFVCSSLSQSDIICFQEYWFEESYQALFRDRLEKDYSFHTYQRTGRKADGIAVLLRRGSSLEVVAQSGHALGSVGDRVALMLHLKQKSSSGEERSLVLANTHLTFPHNTFDRQNQQQQIDDLTKAIDAFVDSEVLPSDTPRIVVGDFNVEEADPVCAHLRDVGYRSAFSTLHSKNRHIVTHFTHRGEELMVSHLCMHFHFAILVLFARSPQFQFWLVVCIQRAVALVITVAMVVVKYESARIATPSSYSSTVYKLLCTMHVQ
jgi:exonuclease III